MNISNANISTKSFAQSFSSNIRSPEKAMANIREVAELAQVSVTTVLHVVNQTRFVAPETEKRVR
jgi:hypothetical protein